jgi:hypothetical protein
MDGTLPAGEGMRLVKECKNIVAPSTAVMADGIYYCSAPRRGDIDAGTAAYHHPAGYDFGRSRRNHAIHSVAGLTGGRTALVMTRPFRAPHRTISDVGLIGGGHVPMPAKCPWPTMACFFWMSCPSSAAMFWRSCVHRSRKASQEYNFLCILDFQALAALVLRLTPPPGAHPAPRAPCAPVRPA